jgi:hypothetical protein
MMREGYQWQRTLMLVGVWVPQKVLSIMFSYERHIAVVLLVAAVLLLLAIAVIVFDFPLPLSELVPAQG